MKIFSLKNWHIVILGIILFFAIVLFLAPRVGCRYVTRHSNELIGRKLDIKKIRINYFTGTIRIHNLVLYEADAKTVFLSFKRLKVNIEYLPLLKSEILVKYISLDDPFAEVLQNGSVFNFDDLTASDTAAVKKDTIPSKPLKYNINNILISGGYIKYRDLQLNHTIAMDKLDLNIPGFTWNSDSTNLDVDFKFVDGGELYSSLDINQADSTYAVNVKLDSLNLNIIEPYIKNSMYISALHGYLSNDITIKGSMKNIMNLFVTGVNHVYGFSLTDTTNRTICSFNELSVDVDTILLSNNRIKLNSINLVDPMFLVELVDTTNNWSALMKPSAPDTAAKPASDTTKASSGSFTFDGIKISGGKVLFADRTLKYPFEYAIDNIEILSTPDTKQQEKLKIHFTALLNGTGNFSTDALVNPSDLRNMDLSLSIGQFRMKDLDSYFKSYFGFPVTGGIMNFKTENVFTENSLKSNNTLYFRKFTLDRNKVPDAKYNIPLRLALGVLSDKDGIIDLKAPVESHGDEVRVKNLGRIILRVIGNLFVKAAVSPFNMLSGSYNVDPSSLQEIDLPLFEPQPDKENLKSIDVISDILLKKPGLNVDFYYCINGEKARDSLALMLSRIKYISYSKSTGAKVNHVNDSTLVAWIRSGKTVQETDTNLKASQICRNFIGEARLNNGIDSVITLQKTFMKSYLSGDRQIPESRSRIIYPSPDTIKPASGDAAFKVYFTAGD
jgi:hypothetical protein